VASRSWYYITHSQSMSASCSLTVLAPQLVSSVSEGTIAVGGGGETAGEISQPRVAADHIHNQQKSATLQDKC